MMYRRMGPKELEEVIKQVKAEKMKAQLKDWAEQRYKKNVEKAFKIPETAEYVKINPSTIVDRP